MNMIWAMILIASLVIVAAMFIAVINHNLLKHWSHHGRKHNHVAYHFTVFTPSIGLVGFGVLLAASAWIISEDSSFYDFISLFWPLVVGWCVAMIILWQWVWLRRPNRIFNDNTSGK